MNIIIPLNKRIIVEPEKANFEIDPVTRLQVKKTTGKIILADDPDKKAPTKGTVISVADDIPTKFVDNVYGSKDPCRMVKPGDIVLFSKYAGVEIITPATEVGKEDRLFLIMREEDILAVIDNKEEK